MLAGVKLYVKPAQMTAVIVAAHVPKHHYIHRGHHHIAFTSAINPMYQGKGHHQVLAEGLLPVFSTQTKVPRSNLPHHIHRKRMCREMPEEVHVLVEGYSSRMALHGSVGLRPLDHGPKV